MRYTSIGASNRRGRAEVEHVNDAIDIDFVEERMKKIRRSMKKIVVSAGPRHILRRSRASL